jgi:hypothetical protein
MMVVRRPADPAKFNGIVIVEWLNVSTGTPLASTDKMPSIATSHGAPHAS